MGETDVTFSKRKSSSSSSLKQKKKKRSHDLSKVDRKNKKRSRSKIRKSKSKKLRRRHDSTSCSDSDDDGDESLNSLSSSDSFLDDHKRKRSRSRTRNDGKKKSKKRSRKRSSSSESESERDERCRVKKRKWSKRKVDVDLKKSRRKKPKRDVKVNSPSSSSPACSISCGASSCDDMRSYLSKRSKYRSPSCSSLSRSSKEDDYQTEEKLGLVNTSRRLRSVITVVKGPSENEVELDKEEIVHDQDDYPSCRSNDSDDAKMKIDEEIKGAQEYAVMGIDVDDRYEASYPSADEYEGPKQGFENKKDDFTDAEKILRQRALENLKKFREEVKLKSISDPKEQKDDAVKQLPPEMTGLLPHNEDGAKVPSAVKVSQENIGPTMLKVDDCSSQHGRRTEAPVLVERKEDGRKLVSTNKGADQIGMIRKLRNSISSMQDDKKRKEGKYTSEDTKKNSQPSTVVLGRESLDLRSSLKQVPTSEQGLKSNPDSNAAEISKPSVNIRDNSGKEVGNNASVSSVTDPSCIKPETGEQSSKDVQGETKDASQYEQKTMSVMRGGELVQVNYKVYIPKKTPALARRQLRR